MIRNVINKINSIRFKHMNPRQRPEYLKEKCYYMGENVSIYTDGISDPYLVAIYDNVNVASGVVFINHDVSVYNMSRLLDGILLDKVGPIILKENCMIGAYSILMPGITVGRNSVIAAGSTVTKNVPDNQVWGALQQDL